MTEEELEFWREESSDSKFEVVVFLCQIALIMTLAILLKPLEGLFEKLKSKVSSRL